VNAARLACALLGAIPVLAAGRGGDVSHFTSASGQFIVMAGPDWRSSPPTRGADLDPETVLLTPTLLTVSAEHLRQHLERELGDSAMWSGRVQLYLQTSRTADDTTRIVAELQRGRWQYRVTIPERMTRTGFLRALIEINLLEMANQQSTGRSAELPVWLVEGFTGHLLATHAWNIILAPPQANIGGVNVSRYQSENVTWRPLAQAQAQLQTNAPLTFEELSWPTANGLEGRTGLVYRNCAQLLVSRLLGLPDGREQMLGFIHALPVHYNWQVSFLEAFRANFDSLLDLEKWWALQVAYFTGREFGSVWSYEESLTRLQATMRVPVQVRMQTNDAPLRSEVSLQTIINEWEPARQARVIEETLGTLAAARLRLAPELLALTDEYRRCLSEYLKTRKQVGIHLPKGADRDLPMMQARQRVLRRLDELDANLEAAQLALQTSAPEPEPGIIPR